MTNDIFPSLCFLYWPDSCRKFQVKKKIMKGWFYVEILRKVVFTKTECFNVSIFNINSLNFYIVCKLGKLLNKFVIWCHFLFTDYLKRNSKHFDIRSLSKSQECRFVTKLLPTITTFSFLPLNLAFFTSQKFKSTKAILKMYYLHIYVLVYHSLSRGERLNWNFLRLKRIQAYS